MTSDLETARPYAQTLQTQQKSREENAEETSKDTRDHASINIL